MNTVICTLFEGDYHYGVAALINSLYKNGFKGDVYAGYKGSLPGWSTGAAEEPNSNDKGIKTLTVTPDLKIHFISVTADYHLTNYKPNFMLEVWDLPAVKDADGMFYFDPDIVVKSHWLYFEEWIDYGIALVHEVSNNDMPPNHPKRKGWEKVIKKADKTVHHQIHSYINAGFCGVHNHDKEFLTVWRDIFQTGVQHFGLSNKQWDHRHTQDYIFFKQDQDAMNIAAMCCDVPLSEMGPEAMDFVSGGYTMSHLVGTPKPWQKNVFGQLLSGHRLTLTDRLFWDNVNYPIKLYSDFVVRQKQISLKTASFLARFYKR